MNEVLQSENYNQRLLAGLRSLYDSDLLCDLSLVADGQQLHVHRAVLAATSDYFKALLTIDMKERCQSVIQLKGVPARGLKEVIRFAYTGQLRCTLDNISDVLLASSHLQMTEAISLCSRYLTNLATMSNSVDMYNLGDQFNLPALKEKSLSLILSHFDDISKKDDLMGFSAKFLGDILADNRLKAFSELKLFQLVLKWISHNRSDRLKYTYSLMSNIRFPLISPTDLVEIVMNEEIMKADTQSLELILEANKYHMLPKKQPLMQNTRTQVRSDLPCLVMLDVDDDGPKVFDLATRTWGALRSSRLETYHSQVCVLDNYMYICGGIELYSSNNPVSAKCYRYDPRFDKWTDICSMQDSRHHFSLVADGKGVFAMGGYCNGFFKNVVEKYIVRENRWVSKCSMDVRLSAAAVSVHDRKIFISGGQTDKGVSRLLHCYQIDTDTWHSRAPMLHDRMDHAMCSYSNRLYVIGGYSKNIVKAFDVNKVECYCIETDQWAVVFENSPKISGIFSCQVENCVYMVGGFTYDENKKRTDVSCYDMKASEWQVIARIHTPAMSVPCCALHLPLQMLRNIAI